MKAETQSRIFGFILLAITLMLILLMLKTGAFLIGMYLLILLMVFVAFNFLSGAWKFVFEE